VRGLGEREGARRKGGGQEKRNMLGKREVDRRKGKGLGKRKVDRKKGVA
jgi:hypothetical protein